MSVDVLTVSSKGQIVLPKKKKKSMSITTGDKLAVYASEDIIMLKAIKMPSAMEFEKKMDEAREWAASVGYKESDVSKIIKSVRKRKRK